VAACSFEGVFIGNLTEMSYKMSGKLLAVKLEQLFDITGYYIVYFLDCHRSSYVLGNLGIFYFTPCHVLCIVLFNTLYSF
jgi:hypothetical protein